MNDDSANDPARVAVIVVHGVADQLAGATARSVVELLVATKQNGATYEAVATNDFTLAVPPLAPTHPPERTTDATPTSYSRPLSKAFAQSFRSDLHRPDWEVAKKAGRGPAAKTARALDAEPDRGLQVTNFLLAKYLDNHAATEAYESSVVTLSRTSPSGAGPHRVDVYEMYWADLSRLSGAIPRIISELFTLVFRLSKLGRGTVDEALGSVKDANGLAKPLSWRCLAFLQTGLDWAFVNLLALLFTQLGMLALVIVPLALAAPQEDSVRWVVGSGLAIFALLWSAYRRRDGARRLALPIALVAIAGVVLLDAASGAWLVPLLWLALLTVALNAALRVSDDRFPFTRASGLTLWTLAVAGVVWFVWRETSPVSFRVWVQAALFGVELVLTAIKWWWIAAAVAFAAWYVAGLAASRQGGYEGSASVDTGRLGMFASLGAFVVLTMALWALASTVLTASVASGDVSYVPRIFPIEENIRGISEASARAAAFPHQAAAAAVPASSACPCAAPTVARGPYGAESFLRYRYEDSTASFSVIAALLLILASYLVAVFVPSVLAELKLLRDKAGAAGRAAARAGDTATRDLGGWLTAGYRYLGSAVSTVVLLSIVGALGVAFVLYAQPAQGAGNWARTVDFAAYLSQVLLKPMVLGAAGIGAALSAFGGVLSRYVPGLRAPLDIALDVDNHFREFPRKSIPRARIFSRYAALLDHVSKQGYDRIVVVAHSQGTVISAELLRFLSDAPRGVPREGHDRCRQLGDRYGGDIRLVTLGCPLRQLYAARFPSLYGWVLRKNGDGNGPLSADIGARRWANAYTSGDYVGRWLWSSPGGDDPLGHPMIDTVKPVVLGRGSAYSPFHPMPPDAQALETMSELEVCLGLGAHTHYFEPDQAVVAWLIDLVVAT